MKKAVPYILIAFIALAWVCLYSCYFWPREDDQLFRFSTSGCLLSSAFSTCSVALASVTVLLLRNPNLPKPQNGHNIIKCVFLPAIFLIGLIHWCDLVIFYFGQNVRARTVNLELAFALLSLASFFCLISLATLAVDHWLRLLLRKLRVAIWIVVFLAMPIFFDQAFSRDDVRSAMCERCDECGSERVIRHGRFHRFFYYEDGEETFITKEGANFEKCRHKWDIKMMRT